MQQSFVHIATFKVFHDYYNGGIFRNLTVTSSGRTSELLSNFSLVIKPFKGGFHLFSADPKILQMADSDVPLRFNLDITNPYYINFTEISGYSPSDQIHYFNNLNPVSEGVNLISLHEADFVSEANIALISNGLISLDGVDSRSTVKVTNVLGESLNSEHIVQDSNQHGRIQLTNIDDGFYTVQYDDHQSSYYLSQAAVWKVPFGILELYLNQIASQRTEERVLEYTLSFQARKTHWRYLLLNSKLIEDYKELSIIEKGNGPAFSSTIKSQPDHKPVMIFDANEVRALSEEYNISLQLVDKYDAERNSGKTLINRLPFPSPEQLFTDNDSPANSYISNIYIS